MSQGRERGPRRAPFQAGFGQVSSSAGPVQGQHKGGNRNMQLEVGKWIGITAALPPGAALLAVSAGVSMQV